MRFLRLGKCTHLFQKVSNIQVPQGLGLLGRYSNSLRAGRSGDRIPLSGRFSVPVQTGPGAHPASYTMGIGSLQGGNRPGRGVDYTPHLAPRVKKELIYTSTHPLVLRGPFKSEIYL